MWETIEGGGRKNCFVIFFILGCFDCWWVTVDGAGQQISFIFLFLVLLKKMRMQGLSLIFAILGTFYHHRS